ncbi:MAG: type II toxin-antitoxin system ParD family antitoxin [Kofleriaceae bacterium]
MASTLTISLTPELKELVDSKVRSGRYGNASEVIREALRNWERGDETEDPELEQLIDQGLASPLVPATEQVFSLIRSRSRQSTRRRRARRARRAKR